MGLLDGWPPFYPEFRTGTMFASELFPYVIVVLVLALAFLALAPGIRGKTKRLMYCVQVFFAIVVGGIIIICAYGQDWDVASVSTVTAYKARSAAHIPAQISVKIGLKSFNVTMTGMPGNQSGGRLQYSERYALDLREFSQDLHTSHLAGVPYPVIKVAEDMALTKLAEYSTTGHYTMMLMWLSLSLWVLTGLLFSLVRRYGAYCLLLTGITLMLAVVPVASTRLGPAHVIHFPNATLRFSLGWCFWTALVTGCLCTSSGLVFSIVELIKHSRDLESSPNQEEVKVGFGSSGVTNLAFETDEQSAGNTNQTTSMNKSGLISTEEKPPHRTVDRKQPPTFLAGSDVCGQIEEEETEKEEDEDTQL
ncbi:PREDICTED: dual oxidase maturation factor 1-like isoform X1 [Branchiostoma belcheri]|uniref:Dual oxidase maturation factor 1-like isoform X1 n=1 Tax=Branchiostoma belcheri TaxID=7741 RepID=A0A6P5A427_BRABE|nr:PREDICTED: dual oxidase maturation factor 1-like isoform X1 [Branchiostoma belcheri]XP_019644183.1 PREDICTED: dual oxidase maturation factor 1-like isoform X1 [Branchiostoma belcheri]